MSVEQHIAELLAQAEPLRGLPDDEAEAKGLPALVDEINRLRAVQAKAAYEADMAIYVEQQQADKIISRELGAALAAHLESESDERDPIPGQPMPIKRGRKAATKPQHAVSDDREPVSAEAL